MKRRNIFRIGLLAAAIMLAAFLRFMPSPGDAGAASRTADLPRLILWAWERPEDLRAIDPRETGVAYLAKTLTLSGERLIARPRLQPLLTPPDTRLFPVVRIESDRHAPPALSDQQRRRAVEEIAELARRFDSPMVQIDFDAKLSERPFYAALLAELRAELPAATRLSITALAAWCIHETWLNDLPIDEAVPMLFRMGVDHEQVASHLRSGGGFRPDVARHSLGLATDEPLAGLPRGRRIYLFSPAAWTDDSTCRALQQVRQWQ